MRRCRAAVNERVKPGSLLGVVGFVSLLLGACGSAAGEEAKQPPIQVDDQSEAVAAMLDPCAKPNLTTVEPGALTFATSTLPSPPFFLTDDPADRRGLEADLAYRLAEVLGFRPGQVTWEFVDPEQLLTGEFVDFDIAIGGLSPQAEEGSAMVFTRPYLESNLVILVQDPETAQELSASSISGEGETSALRWSWPLQGPAASSLADRGWVVDEPVTFSSVDQLVNGGPVSQAVDVVVVDVHAGRWLEIVAEERLVPVEVVDSPNVEYVLGLVAGNPLSTCVDRALSEMSENGSLLDLENLWLDPLQWVDD